MDELTRMALDRAIRLAKVAGSQALTLGDVKDDAARRKGAQKIAADWKECVMWLEAMRVQQVNESQPYDHLQMLIHVLAETFHHTTPSSQETQRR